jgi:hypothetical protein
MDFNSPFIARYIRIVALISLMLGLNDATRLLGVDSGADSPLTILGTTGFTLLAIFCLARLFAAVGLWIRASWGAVLLVAATGLELFLYLGGSPDVRLGAIGFGIRVILLISLVAIFGLALRRRRAQAAD